MNHHISRILLLTIGFLLFPSAYADSSRELFARYADRLFQIKVLEKTSGRKSAIGSGFMVRPDGLMVSNYHVISKFIAEPDRYYLEALSSDNRSEKISVEDIDVINDLALLRIKGRSLPYLQVSSRTLRKGDTIYSMGNPLDLGTAVVPGTYNGYTKQSFYQRIHFTGAINPGMSGGPVLNENGQVVGVNVATAGNQVGFLVVADKLAKLLHEYEARKKPTRDFKKRIRSQLMQNQQRMMQQVMQTKWQTVQLGDAKVLKEIAPFLPCWGDKSHSRKQKERFFTVSVNCMPKENIYLSPWFRTGMIEVQYKWVENRSLSSMQFSQLLGQLYGGARAGNSATEKDVTEFSCHESFVKNPDARVAFCSRAYKDYPGLFDVLFISTTVGFSDKGLMSHFTLSGVSRDTASQFMKRFMEASQWN